MGHSGVHSKELLTVGALPAAVPKLSAQVAGPQLLRVGAAVGHVPTAPATEAAHGRVLKVLVKVPGNKICFHQYLIMHQWERLQLPGAASDATVTPLRQKIP